MSKIILTGAAGFIGSHVAESLLLRGDKVIAIDNFDPFYSADAKWNNLLLAQAREGFIFHKLDIRDRPAVDHLFRTERPDSVIHLAARAGVRDSITNPAPYFDINVNGTLAILESAKNNRIPRVVFASSSSVYGGVNIMPLRESTAIAPISPYAASKAAGEAFCSAYAATSQLSIGCCRFFTVYGPRQRPDMAITKFARALRQGKTITVFGDGTSARDYTFISDIVGGVLAVNDAQYKFELFNLGSMVPIPLTRVIRSLGERLSVLPRIAFAAVQQGEPPMTLADITKAQSQLGYNPATEFESGLNSFVTWLENTRDDATTHGSPVA